MLWVRVLALRWGADSWAACVVVSAFMAGLGAGGGLLGRRADRAAEPLRSYAGLEAAVAGVALAVTAGLGALGPVAALCAVLPVAVMVGATMPWLAAVARRSGNSAGFGALYVWNALGGACGALAADFILVPALGLRRSSFAAAGLSLAAAGLAWLGAAAAAEPADGGPPSGLPADEAGAAPSSAWVPWLALATGFAALAHESVWLRLMSLVVGSSVYSLAVVLAVILLGAALGGGLASRLAASPRRVDWTAAALVGAGLCAAVPARWFGLLPDLFVRLRAGAPEGLGGAASVAAAVAAAALLPVWTLLGVAFPTLAALSARRPRAGEETGRLYAFNGLGAAAGPWLAVYTLIPALGLPGAAWICAAAVAALGAALFAAAETPALRRAAPWLAASVLIAGFFTPDVSPADLQGGVFMLGPAAARRGPQWRRELEAMPVLFAAAGREADVLVRRRPDGETSLVIAGKPDASEFGDAPTQLLLGHLPFLLRARAARPSEAALVLGLGSAMTVAAVARHQVGRIDVLELEPAVAAAARSFERANRGVLRDARVHLLLGDARRSLERSAGVYGVIVSQPSNPWQAGMSHLFTREFLTLLRSRLAPEGVLCQWLNNYETTPEALAVVLATVRAVFPSVQVWESGADLLILASEQPVALDWSRLASRLASAEFRLDLARSGVASVEGLLARWVMDEHGIGVLAGRWRAALHTDDRPVLAYLAPRGFYDGRASAAAYAATHQAGEASVAFVAAPPDGSRRVARALLAAGRLAPALRAIAALPVADPWRDGLQRDLGESLLRVGQPAGAAAVFRARAQTRPRDPAAQLDLARAALEGGDSLEARVALERFGALTGGVGPAGRALDAARAGGRPAQFYLAAGLGYEALGEGWAAAQAFGRAFALEPGLLQTEQGPHQGR